MSADQIDGERVLIRKCAQFALDVVKRQFRHLEQDQPLWA